MKSYIKGKYKKAIFTSDKGYFIGLFHLDETDNDVLSNFVDKTITFTGYFHELNEGDTYIFHGEEVEHPRYGLQFNVTEYEKVKPEDKDGVIEFLSSSLFPKVGKKLATSIVEVLGDKCLDKILEDKSILNLVPKITTKKIDLIYDNLLKYDESHQVIVYLTELGFNMKDSLEIYNKYKKDTLSIINDNIYRLIDDELDISFLKIDEVGRKLNIDRLDDNRIEALIIYLMKSMVFKSGDTYLNYQDIYDALCKYLNLGFDEIKFDDYLNKLNAKHKVCIEGRKYYLKEMFDAGNSIVEKIKILLSLPKNKYKNIDSLIEEHEKMYGITYNTLQKEAIKSSLEENILIITGGPGTGKTTIVKEIIELYRLLNKLSGDDMNKELQLLTPTGRASKRLSEATGYPATTIHRFLKWNKETNTFAIDEYNKDYSKFIIIDEVSMIDEQLLDSLFKGLTDNIKIILVGDYNQLPSVSPGQVLKDLIDSNVIKTIHLEELYRQSKNSYINTLANEIKNNDLSPNFLDQKSDYTFLECSSHSIRSNLINLSKQILEKGYDYKNVQIMAPLYKGENGIDILNNDLQQIFNPKDKEKNELKIGDVTFRENDKVLQLVNMPEENIFNGDIGVINRITPASISKSGKTEIYIDFDSNIVKFLPKDFNKFRHGFVISIHKSQGSEFEVVVMPISYSYHRMLYRKLVYTGITRAKKKLILLGEADVFVSAVSNNQELVRNTSLKEKLMMMNNNLNKR